MLFILKIQDAFEFYENRELNVAIYKNKEGIFGLSLNYKI